VDAVHCCLFLDDYDSYSYLCLAYFRSMMRLLRCGNDDDEDDEVDDEVDSMMMVVRQ
jgi:anthranilate/para-aminobenzoate synthase component II